MCAVRWRLRRITYLLFVQQDEQAVLEFQRQAKGFLRRLTTTSSTNPLPTKATVRSEPFCFQYGGGGGGGGGGGVRCVLIVVFAPAISSRSVCASLYSATRRIQG